MKLIYLPLLILILIPCFILLDLVIKGAWGYLLFIALFLPIIVALIIEVLR